MFKVMWNERLSILPVHLELTPSRFRQAQACPFICFNFSLFPVRTVLTSGGTSFRAGINYTPHPVRSLYCLPAVDGLCVKCPGSQLFKWHLGDLASSCSCCSDG